MTNYSTSFTDAFNQLNEKQKEAVTNIDGPVMVLAGPGTGKTEVLAVRIGQILLAHDMKPSNILCLTYSNAGVEAMRNRLRELIGDTADQIAINTYHSFSNSLIKEYASNDNSLIGRSLITDGQRYMLIEKLIYDFLANKNPSEIKPASIKKIKSYVQIFNVLKQENITAQEIAKHAEHCITNILPFEPDYLTQRGLINAAGKKLIVKIQDFATNISAMYGAFENELISRNKYEFEDMLEEALLLLVDRPELLQGLQERYQYILVDEFQDTNAKQVALLNQLVNGVEAPNLFIVGDDDQCIYRFQGANSNNFTWMRNKFSKLRSIVLDINYRSTPKLLQQSFGLISLNKERQPEKDSPLSAGNSAYTDGNHAAATIKVYENAEQEACSVAKAIQALREKDNTPSSIAVLARRHSDLDPVKKWLDFYKIPSRKASASYNLLDNNYGAGLFNTLQFIRCYDGDSYLAEGFLIQLLLRKNETAAVVKAFLKYKKEKGSNFYLWLKMHQHETAIKYLKNFISLMDSCLQEKDGVLTEQYLNTLTEIANLSINEQATIDDAIAWKKFADDFSEGDRYNTAASLADMLWYYKQTALWIKVDAKYDENQNADAVILSTIHGSKGLQYDAVFVTANHGNNWENKSDRGKVLVPKLLNRYIVPEGDSLDDLRKLLYVACTRAKTSLQLSLHRMSDSEAVRIPSSLLEPFIDTTVLEDIPAFELPINQSPLYPVSADVELAQLITDRLVDFEISPSSTGSWEICQNAFFFNYVIKMPGTSSEATSFGSLIHDVLQAIAGNITWQHNRNAINHVVDEEYAKYRLHFHSTHGMRYKEYAKWLILDYLTQFPFTHKPDSIEQTYHSVLTNGVKLKGKLDRVESKDRLIRIVDYKTGRYKGDLKEFESAENTGTQYWRQAMIYSKLMIDNFRDAASYRFEFHYPEITNGIYDFDYEANPLFEEWLGTIWNQIQSLQFKEQCENVDCVYCKARLQ